MKLIVKETAASVDEARLIERVLGGDAEAFTHFVRAYQRKVYGLSLRLLRDAGEAECVAQEAFIKAYQGLPGFRGGSSFETWVTRIAVNACRDRLKRKRVVVYFHQSTSRDDDEGEPRDVAASAEPSPERVTFSREIQKHLRAAMEKLSPQQKIIFTLKHLEERSIPEIAEMMGLDAGTIKSHLFRASSKIRKSLGGLRRSS